MDVVIWLFIAVIVMLVIMLCGLLAANGGLSERVDDAHKVIEDWYNNSTHKQSTLDIYCKKWGVLMSPQGRMRDKGKRRK